MYLKGIPFIYSDQSDENNNNNADDNDNNKQLF